LGAGLAADVRDADVREADVRAPRVRAPDERAPDERDADARAPGMGGAGAGDTTTFVAGENGSRESKRPPAGSVTMASGAT
jgi:hypothetical protein